MHKSILMYSLLALGYFVFSTLPFTEVSAQTITISGNEQSTTRGNNFPNQVDFTLAGFGQVNLFFGADDATQVSYQENSGFASELSQVNVTNGTYTIYVKAKSESLYDACEVSCAVQVGNQFTRKKFTGTITDVLYFPRDSQGDTIPITRSVAENSATGTNIGSPISATHWANEDTDTSNDVTLTYSLVEENDHASFSIDSGTGQLKVNTALDYETKNSYTVTVKVKRRSNQKRRHHQSRKKFRYNRGHYQCKTM